MNNACNFLRNFVCYHYIRFSFRASFHAAAILDVQSKFSSLVTLYKERKSLRREEVWLNRWVKQTQDFHPGDHTRYIISPVCSGCTQEPLTSWTYPENLQREASWSHTEPPQLASLHVKEQRLHHSILAHSWTRSQTPSLGAETHSPPGGRNPPFSGREPRPQTWRYWLSSRPPHTRLQPAAKIVVWVKMTTFVKWKWNITLWTRRQPTLGDTNSGLLDESLVLFPPLLPPCVCFFCPLNYVTSLPEPLSSDCLIMTRMGLHCSELVSRAEGRYKASVFDDLGMITGRWIKGWKRHSWCCQHVFRRNMWTAL